MKPFFQRILLAPSLKGGHISPSFSHILLTIPPTCRTTAFYKRLPSITKSFKHISHMDSQALPGTATIFPSVHPFSAESCTSSRCLWFLPTFPVLPSGTTPTVWQPHSTRKYGVCVEAREDRAALPCLLVSWRESLAGQVLWIFTLSLLFPQDLDRSL